MRIILAILLANLYSLNVTAQLSVPDIKTMPGENAASLKQSGTPETSTRIVMRCGPSISKGNEPLYVVDGVPYESNQIKFLDPNNIERIEILKDASASAIYGYRAAHGVILILTKKAYVRKFTIKDSKDRVGVGFATITATSLKTGDSVSFMANEFGRIETGLLKYLDYKLTVTCSGYSPKQILLRDVMKSKYEILLEREVSELKEITVVGYAVRRVCTTLRCTCAGVRIQTFQVEKNVFETNKEVKIYPNPVSASGTINISFPNSKEGLYQIRLTSSSGQVIYSCQKLISNKNQTEQILLPAYSSAGVYLLQVVDEQKKIVQSSKVVIQ